MAEEPCQEMSRGQAFRDLARPLVKVLEIGSHVAKQAAADALAHLAGHKVKLLTFPSWGLHAAEVLPSWLALHGAFRGESVECSGCCRLELTSLALLRL